MKYKAALFDPAGEHVIDFLDKDTIKEVWTEIDDACSKWVFFPFCFVLNDDHIVVDTCEHFPNMKGASLDEVVSMFENPLVNMDCQ